MEINKMMSTVCINRERELRNGWWVLAFYLILGASIIAVSQLAGHDKGMPVWQQLVVIVAITWICQLIRRKAVTEISGKFNSKWIAEFAGGGAVGAALMIAPAMFLVAGGWVTLGLSDQPWSAVGVSAAQLLVAAILEELVFRGFVFRRIHAGLGVWPALIITSGFFVLTHLGNPEMTGTVKVIAGTIFSSPRSCSAWRWFAPAAWPCRLAFTSWPMRRKDRYSVSASAEMPQRRS